MLKKQGISFDKGLSDYEARKIEEEFKIIFSEDLKLLLRIALPVSAEFIHWRYGINSKKGNSE